MNDFSLYIVATFIASLVCGVVCILLITKFCKEKKLYDTTSARKIHKDDIPRLGGISFMPSMALACVGTIFAFNMSNSNSEEITISLWSAAFIVSVLIIYVCGIIDDIVGLRPTTKFAFQLVAASILVMTGLCINDLHGFLGIHEVPIVVGAPLTVLTIVLIDNAMNLIDGIDGLAAALSLVALSGLLACFAIDGLPIFCILIAGLMGVLLAFMYFNVFGSVKRSTKIFMGDSGSLTLGFTLGFLFVKLVMDDGYVHRFSTNRLLIATSLIAVPLLDTMRVIVSRIVHCASIFTADKNHLHHKLLRAGLSQHQTLGVVFAMALSLIAVNMGLSRALDITAIAIVDIVLYMAAHTLINILIKRNGRKPFITANGND